MKIRTGFVSNSSSSSFTCMKCGEAFEGWDGDYNDVEQVECRNGHNFCSNCVDLPEDEEDSDYKWNFPTELCPICTFQKLTNYDALRYLAYKYKDTLTKKQILAEMKEQFSGYEDFLKKTRVKK